MHTEDHKRIKLSDVDCEQYCIEAKQ